MNLEDAIRTRRTIKAFGREPVDHQTIRELLELARWAPNHRLTNPWRFRVLGPQALERLKKVQTDLAVASAPAGADPARVAEAAIAKLDRAPTLVVCSVARCQDESQYTEDCYATAAAIYIVLLAAHGRGLASYWRTPEVLRSPEGFDAVGIDPLEEDIMGLLHLGRGANPERAPERDDVEAFVSFLD